MVNSLRNAHSLANLEKLRIKDPLAANCIKKHIRCYQNNYYKEEAHILKIVQIKLSNLAIQKRDLGGMKGKGGRCSKR
jgi:hypothetical protein